MKKKYIVVIKYKHREPAETDGAFLFKAKNEDDLIKKVAAIIGYEDEKDTLGFSYTPFRLFLNYHFMMAYRYVKFNWKELRGDHNE